MRKLWTPALAVAMCALVSCAPLQAAGWSPAVSVASMPSPAVSMENTKMPELIRTEPAAVKPEVSSPPQAAEAEPAGEAGATKDLEALVAAGLQAHWAGRQAIVVRATGGGPAEAELRLFDQTGGEWKLAAGPWPAMIGMNGVSKTAEGDGKSPSGAFLLGSAFGSAAKPDGANYQYWKLDGSDRWVDDAPSPFYNRWVRGAKQVCGSGEELSEIKQYKYAIVVHYNDDAIPDKGSAIFLHVWLGPGRATHGCTAISEDNMVKLLKWLDYSAHPVLVQGDGGQIERLMKEDWNLLCLPQGWGFADDFVQDAQLEIRYNTENNFTGRRVEGYQAPLAPMRMDAVEALAAAASELRGKNLGIRIYDAYRPQQATDAMIAWAEDEADTSTKAEYYPGIDKADIPGHYVARRSAHRLGGTVDLTVLNWKTGKNLDMGGPFDFFGEMSSLGYGGLTEEQAANRMLLNRIMIKYGFKPYGREWWHFSFPEDDEDINFPILPREHVIQ